MNMQEKEILKKLKEFPYTNQRMLAEAAGISLGKVNQCLRQLFEAGYLTEENGLTVQAEELFVQNAPKNAIILAAGYGMRMMPINTELSKGMITVHGEVMIERQIRQLHDAGITDITVVVGFMKENYEYLIDEYGVQLVVNTEYGTRNNLHSVSLVADRIENTYILPCDIWCEENPFDRQELYSWYMVTELVDDESEVRVNRRQELVRASGGNQMIGISYIAKDDAPLVRTRILECDGNRQYREYFWEEALFFDNKLLLAAKLVNAAKVYEINTYEQLRELDADSGSLHAGVLRLIASALEVAEEEIRDITVLKKGMTNRSFLFSCQGRRYIMRVPGEGTAQLINRKGEYASYEAIRDTGICDEICYIDPESGYKLTRYIEHARTCDPGNLDEVAACMKRLRAFHASERSVEHTFDIFGQIAYYESLWNGAKSCYRDYEETKRKIGELQAYIKAQPKQWGLAHIDAVPDNFLLYCNETGEEEIRLIDWEYAGMQDVHVDIAMFAIYAMYDRAQVEQLIDLYFTEGCDKEVRRKIYAYIAVCGFLWSNWCEYKRQLGVEFGEYSLRQYRYAKEYYRIWKEDGETCQK